MTLNSCLKLSLTAAAALLAFAPAAAAGKDFTIVADRPGSDGSLSRRVGFKDLDLASAAGVKSLHARIGRAVRQVCAPFAESGDPHRQHGCTSFAWNGARPQIARAVEHAQQLASGGTTSIAPMAIVIATPR